MSPVPHELVTVTEQMRRSYRVQCALFCLLPERYRHRKYVHGMALRLLGELDAGKERSSEKWRPWGAILEGAPWAPRPWKEIAYDLATNKLTLETILEGSGVSGAEVRRMVLNPMAFEAADDELQEILTVLPTTIEEFRRWLEVGLAPATEGEIIVLPEKAQSEGNTTPLEWMWELWCYSNARSDDGEWRELSEEELELGKGRCLLHGSRGGMKTMGLAALLFSLCWFIPDYSACHAAATIDQARTVVSYIKRWVGHPYFKPKILKALMREVWFDNGSALWVITANQEGFNHEHTLWLSCDEVELMKYKDLLQGLRIPMKRPGRKYPAVTVLASTQKEPGLTMTILIEKALNGEYRYFRWNVFDVVERCEDWRTKNLPAGLRCSDYLYWKNQESSNADSERGEQQALYDRALYYLDALKTNCPLIEYCQGAAKQGCGHYSIKEVINALSDSMEQFEAEMMCLRPSPVGAVYPKFDYRNITEEAEYRDNCRIVGSADYGYATDPAAANLMCVYGPYYDVFEEFSANGMQAYQQADIYKELDAKYGVEIWCVDGSARELITEMKKRGMRVQPVKSMNISRGIELLSRWVLDAAGHRSLRIHPRCRVTIRQMQSYMLSDTTHKPKMHQDDHHPDGLRYMAETVGDKRGRPTQLRGSHPIGISPGARSALRVAPIGTERIDPNERVPLIGD